MDRIWQQYVATPRGVLGLHILHSLDNEFVKDGIDKLLTQWWKQSPGETPSQRVVTHEQS